MPDIFANEAPKFWKNGLPVVPCKGKEALIPGWPGLLGGTPSEAKKVEWLKKYANSNIGMLLGFEVESGENLVALDVDDDDLLKPVLHMLGLNRSDRRRVLAGKRGKKGATIFVRAPKSLKSTVIKGSNGFGNIDFLAAGKMTVMPPSIHPESGKSYQVYGQSILDVNYADLPGLTEQDINILRIVIGSDHARVLFSGTATHDAGVALTAVLVRAGATDENIASIFTALLPDNYSGDTFQELPEWIRSARAKGFEENGDEAATLTEALVRLGVDSTLALFNDGEDNAFATLPRTGGSIAYRIRSEAFKRHLRHVAYETSGKAVSSAPLAEAIATLETKALFDGQIHPVYTRIAGNDEEVAIDIGAPDGRIVSITADGWEIGTQSAFKFVRGSGFEKLPEPAKGDDLAKLQAFLGIDGQNFKLLVAFLINALKPTGPYFILLVEGEQGSGKSFFCEVVKRIIDPNKAMRLRLPDKPQDLMIHAKEYRLLSFDNASGVRNEMSDSLCTLSTGGGIAVRKLYSDGDLHVMSYARPFMINGIAGYANRPDLMERAIPIRLTRMGENGRRTEKELLEEFERLMPGILGSLYDAVAHALKTMHETEPPRHLRMADAAQWINAAEPALKLKGGSIIDAITQAQDEFVVERVNEDSLVNVLRAICRSKPFEGRVIDLFTRLGDYGQIISDHTLPKTPALLSGQLKRMRPAMEKAGIHVDFLGRDRNGMKVRISCDDPDLASL